MKTFNKILVANRSAIARRVIRAADARQIPTVSVYADPDAQAPYLAEASETIRLPGDRATETYLNIDAILAAAAQAGADAIHPGYGFLAESAEFARRVTAAGLTFIGPRSEWLDDMGDKVKGRALFAEHGFPVFPGSGLIEDDHVREAERIGWPIMVKPSGGGGGKGMAIARDAEALEQAVAQSRAIALAAFAEPGVFLEKLVERPRHIEYQIIADNAGRAIHAFERDCSVQRRHQKLIEESPAPGINEQELLAHAERAADVCSSIGYNNLGTLETLRDPSGATGFLEMNTRIQVEHAVTEEITGLDLVGLQIDLAAGGAVPDIVTRDGHAIEARIYAEDPHRFYPSTGRLGAFEFPTLHGVRVETGYQSGQVITPYYDAMLAKVIARAHTRELAIGRLCVALGATVIRGVETNIPLLQRILKDHRFLAGDVHTGFIDEL